MTARYRCPQCRTRRASWRSLLDHMAKAEHRVCQCGGYWFPHRRGSGACDYSPRSDYFRALRQGLSQSEAEAELSAHVLERMP